MNGIALRLFQHGPLVCGGVHVDAVAEGGVVVAVEGGLADVQAMAVPEARLGMPLLGAVVKRQLQDSDSVELGGGIRSVGDHPLQGIGVGHDAGALARPIGVNEDKLGLAMLSLRSLDRLAEAPLLAEALEQGHAVRVVVGEEGHRACYFSLATSDLRPMVRVMKSRSRLGLRAGEYSRP